jgi:hypothetical protein
MWETRNTYKIFYGKPEWNRTILGRPRCKCEDNIKLDLKETGFEDADLIQLRMSQMAIFCEHGNERWPSGL